METKRKRGRPKATDPKLKLQNVRLKSSIYENLREVCQELEISESDFVQAALEKELKKYKEF